MIAQFNLRDYIEEKLANTTTPTLELYFDNDMLPYQEDHVYEEIVVPSPVEVFVSEINTRRLVLPSTLKVLDVLPFLETDLQLNIPPNLQTIIIRFANIVGKTLTELFPINAKYEYESCKLEGVELHTLINAKYEKYFGVKPRYNTNRLYNQIINRNGINKRLHGQIINEMLTYEQNIKLHQTFCQTIRDDLNAAVWHPNRVCRWYYAGVDLESL